MKSTHSIDHELLQELILVAGIAMLRCDFKFDLEHEVLEKMASALVTCPEALSSQSKGPSLLQAVKSVNNSGLTGGYQVSLDDIRGLLSQAHLVDLLLKNTNGDIDQKRALNIFHGLADLAGYHFLLYEADSLLEGYVEYFNERKPEFFKHQISSSELLLLYYYYNFVSKFLDWQEDARFEKKPRLRLVK